MSLVKTVYPTFTLSVEVEDDDTGEWSEIDVELSYNYTPDDGGSPARHAKDGGLIDPGCPPSGDEIEWWVEDDTVELDPRVKIYLKDEESYIDDIVTEHALSEMKSDKESYEEARAEAIIEDRRGY